VSRPTATFGENFYGRSYVLVVNNTAPAVFFDPDPLVSFVGRNEILGRIASFVIREWKVSRKWIRIHVEEGRR